jgi:leader peptidase (prepilin peptidase)/N-methyltransferase
MDYDHVVIALAGVWGAGAGAVVARAGRRGAGTALLVVLVCVALAVATGIRPELAVWLLLAPVALLPAVAGLALPASGVALALLGVATLLPEHAGHGTTALLGALALGAGYYALSRLGRVHEVPPSARKAGPAASGARSGRAGRKASYWTYLGSRPVRRVGGTSHAFEAMGEGLRGHGPDTGDGGGVGAGDVRLAVVAGVALGWYGWPTVMLGAFAGFLLRAMYGAVPGRRRRTGVPFGPFLLAGAFLGLLVGAYTA